MGMIQSIVTDILNSDASRSGNWDCGYLGKVLIILLVVVKQNIVESVCV